jgi:hypothetical protein
MMLWRAKAHQTIVISLASPRLGGRWLIPRLQGESHLSKSYAACAADPAQV